MWSCSFSQFLKSKEMSGGIRQVRLCARVVFYVMPAIKDENQRHSAKPSFRLPTDTQQFPRWLYTRTQDRPGPQQAGDPGG